MLGPADPLPTSARRYLVAGPPGSGKSTLARLLADGLGVPWVEIDSLYHGPEWTPRPTFTADVDRFTSTPAWVTEWGYRTAKPLLAGRADVLVWLDHPRWTVFTRLVTRTVVRRVRRVELWNGNVEPPFRTFLTDRDHIVRWAWRVYGEYATGIPELASDPEARQLSVVRLRGQREVDQWLAGPFAAAVAAARPDREVLSFPPAED